VVYIPGIDGSPFSGDRVLDSLADAADCAQFMFPVTRSGPHRANQPTSYPGISVGANVDDRRSRRANLSLIDMAGEVDAWMERMGWESAMMIGESYGGAVAQTLALKFPRRVQRLALVASFTRHPARVIGGLLGPALRVMPRWSLKLPIKAAASMTVLKNVEKDRRATYYERTFQMPFDDIGRRIKALRAFDSRGFMRGKDWPKTLWVWGEREGLVNHEAESKWLRSVHPEDMVVVIAGAGHVIPANQPDVLAAHLRSFLGLGRSVAMPPVGSP